MNRPQERDRGLTGREREVLHLVAEGYTDAEIGRALHISIYTAQNHVKSILGKLKARNRAHAGAMYVRGNMADSSY